MANILVNEAEDMLRRTLRTRLERAGHTVVEAADGDEGMAQFKLQRPDLVLTDIIMPNREGVETIGEMRREAPDLPIIAMSGGGSRGGDKPIRQAELIAAVERCLDRGSGDYDRAAAR